MKQKSITRIVKTMTPAMKETLQELSEIKKIREKVHPGLLSRKKFHPPEKVPLMLPEEFSGRDLKAAKRLMKQLERKQRKTKKK